MMKKAIVLVLLAAFVVPAFADDAITLPAGVMRTRIAPSFTFINAEFDEDGKREDLDDSIQAVNLSAAIEYGITDWLTAGVLWVPGWRIYTDLPADNAVLTGVHDLFVGAKMQIVGPQGLVPNSDFRFAVTPGVKLPLSQYDASDEADNLIAGDDWQPGRVDRGAWGFGGWVAFDYIINPNFYINLFNETVFYAPTDQDYGIAVVPGAGVFPVEDVEVKYGTELTFELEAAYAMDLNGGVRLGLGLPVKYEWTGETEIEGDGMDDESWILSVGPNVSFFFTEWALPMEFELGYSIPIAGESTNASNTISLQIKNFFRF